MSYESMYDRYQADAWERRYAPAYDPRDDYPGDDDDCPWYDGEPDPEAVGAALADIKDKYAWRWRQAAGALVWWARTGRAASVFVAEDADDFRPEMPEEGENWQKIEAVYAQIEAHLMKHYDRILSAGDELAPEQLQTSAVTDDLEHYVPPLDL